MLDTLATSFQKLPVTIITGFLGSGKTTLLNYILQNFAAYKVAVLVNEFGDINIDSQLLVAVAEDMIELTNGCICCTINDNLADAVYRVLDRQDQIDYLIVETTGVAEPLPIALTFLGTELRTLTQLNAIVTVVDAETFTPAEHYNSGAAINQILYGDIILLNKTDLVSERRVNELEGYLCSVKERARILRSEYGKVPLSLILDVNLAAFSSFAETPTVPDNGSQHLNNDGFMSVSFQSNRPIALKKFQQFLDYQLPDNVFRAKGVLWFAESPKRHLFQLSGKRFTIDDSEWIAPPANQMVLIGRKLDALFLIQTLNNCLTQ
ncbi:CobW family GTP-binding protein [Gloeocapsopsis dulcis]|uniref:Cobalamin biosynthesis protein CobW n=1 Tax=Gloeocapsopsis dulcis AAB1 = 1H9 TaxID=1433147 RepID=A0A6N8FXL9_9CHRO|nr:GTP-binding protein [Gloeocapsopsis dulcis]MUL37878.1 cobalamin biosynthesis protein CobW [Gloeocapsopsis dulcis AAB1 = 1H9]WNN92314.1 GTP-binding protein [Gloeocapsopsis dulcis]